MSDALTDPRGQALLNTSPDELDTLATQFSTVSGQAQTSSDGLRGAHGDLNWTGKSADAFRTQLGKLPSDLDTVHASYSQIATALHAYATNVGPVRTKFVAIRQQLSADSQSLSTAQTNAGNAQTAYNQASNAKGAKPTDSSVTSAHTSLTTAQGKVTQLQGEVSGLNTQALRLLGEFDTLRGACISQIKDASGKAPQHHTSVWGSICHVADDVGGFLKKTAVGIYHDVKDLPSDLVTFCKDPTWEHFGKLMTDVAVTASLVAMVAAPFAAPELLEADGALAATDVAADAATDVVADTVTDTTADTVTETTADAATETTTDAATETASDGAKTYSTFTKAASYTDKVASRTFTGAGLANSYSDAATGNWRGALVDAAFVAVPNLGGVKNFDGIKTFGDRTTDVMHIGDGTAESAEATAKATTNVRNWYAMGMDPETAADLEGLTGKSLSKAYDSGSTEMPGSQLNSATERAEAHATHAGAIAVKVGKPVSIAIDNMGYDPAKEALKGEPPEDAPQHPIFTNPFSNPLLGAVPVG